MLRHKPHPGETAGAAYLLLPAALTLGVLALAGCGYDKGYSGVPTGTTTVAPDQYGRVRVQQVADDGYGGERKLVATYGTPKPGQRIVHVYDISDSGTADNGPYVQFCQGNTLVTGWVTTGLPWLGGNRYATENDPNAPVCVDHTLSPADPQVFPSDFQGSQGTAPSPAG